MSVGDGILIVIGLSTNVSSITTVQNFIVKFFAQRCDAVSGIWHGVYTLQPVVQLFINDNDQLVYNQLSAAECKRT